MATRALPRSPWARFGLLGKFAVVSLVPIVLLGLALTHVLQGAITQRALVNARQSAALLEQALVRPQLAPADLSRGMTGHRIASLDRVLQPSVQGRELARVKIWNLQGRTVYATDHAIIGKRFPPSSELQAAFAGRPASEVSDLRKAENAGDRSFGKLLEVYVPLRLSSGGPVVGAFELYLPYLPIEAAIAHDTTQLTLVLLGGLALLYLALFRIVASASTRLRRQADENEHLALHDPLTDLPNRSLFQDRAAQAILATKRVPGRVGLLLLDLNRFKEVNDTLGHHNGDLLLQEIGGRLRAALRESDSIARLGGDEFGVLLPTIGGPEAALAVAEKIRQALRRPFVLAGVALDLDASVGVALYPEHGDDVETLLQRADVAMYVAKHDHSGCELYSPGRDEYSPARLALAAELRRAIDQDELVLYYQPKAALADGRVAGLEALVRWQHPDLGLLAPDRFIPLAERTGLIRDLTHSVLGTALAQLRAWRAEGLDLCVSVNVSARDLLDLELPATVARLLERYDVPAEALQLEITESVILADPLRARSVLARLDAMGIELAIDDFGSGYSSLAYLKRLPVSEIKIDRSFVMSMERDEEDAVIVRSTIDLGRNLGLRVVAEGVESAAVWETLTGLHCDEGQGYYLSRPIPGPDVAGWLQGRHTGPLRAALPEPARAAANA